MSRWNISNWVRPIGVIQFRTMVSELKLLAEASFGTPCFVELRAMNRLKHVSSNLHDDYVRAAVASENDDRTFFRTSELDDVTAKVFNAAAYVEASIRPINPAAGPPDAWAHAEFKGLRPSQATFYIQPDDNNIAKRMRTVHKYRIAGDGYKGNA